MQTLNKHSFDFAEPIEISFALENTIKPSITFEDINLLWTFTSEYGETFTNMNLFKSDVSNEERNSIFNIVASTFIKAIQLNEREKKVIVIKVTPRFTGHLVIKGVVGKISVSESMKLVSIKSFKVNILLKLLGNKRTDHALGQIEL